MNWTCWKACCRQNCALVNIDNSLCFSVSQLETHLQCQSRLSLTRVACQSCGTVTLAHASHTSNLRWYVILLIVLAALGWVCCCAAAGLGWRSRKTTPQAPREAELDQVTLT